MNRLLAFFGSDVDVLGYQWVEDALEQGYRLLSLDVRAVGQAERQRWPHTVHDDWVDGDQRLAAEHAAHRHSACWYESAHDLFTLNDICWPEFDAYALWHYFRELATARALADSFAETGVSEVAATARHSRRGGSYAEEGRYGSSYVFSTLLSQVCESRVRLVDLPEVRSPTPVSIRSYVGDRTRSARMRIRNSVGSRPADLNGRIVFCMAWFEANRMAPLVRAVEREAPGTCGVVLHSADPIAAAKLSKELRVPVLAFSSSSRGDDAVRDRFANGWREIRRDAVNEDLRLVPFHPVTHATERWPRLVQDLGLWATLWEESAPRSVVASSLQDAEIKMPLAAARRLGVQALTIPHAALSWDGHGEVDLTLFGAPIQRTIYLRTGVPREKLVACSDLIVASEYEERPSPLPTERERTSGINLLVLTNPFGYPDLTTPTVSPRAQLGAFRVLESLGTRDDLNVSFVTKFHPSGLDRDLVHAIPQSPKMRVLPFDSELAAPLHHADGVIALNYCGSAALHVLSAEKPVVWFWTDQLLGQLWPYGYADVLAQVGTLARSEKELLDWITLVSRRRWNELSGGIEAARDLLELSQADPLSKLLLG